MSKRSSCAAPSTTGWRGSLAVRMTLAGVILLILSYFGTKLVLEVILGRSWQL